MRLVMIDNYDSFTYNLVQLFFEFNLEVLVFRHDAVTLAEIEALKPAWLCISPGPKAPAQAGISKAAIAHFYRRLPILGVCLGHQAINEVFGGATLPAPAPVHGKTSRVFHQGRGLFAGLPAPFVAARYHSLMAASVSPDLEVTARSEDGVIMGLSHRRYPLHGVQFHPESFLTGYGRQLAANFLREGQDSGLGDFLESVGDRPSLPWHQIARIPKPACGQSHPGCGPQALKSGPGK
ncbi:MAG: anthranilate synthase component II [Desulfobaccales bacterium]